MSTVIEALRATTLFAHLPDEQLSRLSGTCQPIALQAGDRLIEEGTDGDAFFVIVEGEFEVTKRSGTSDLPLARLGPGGVMGEMAVIEGRARNASVTAATDGRVLLIPSAALMELLSQPASALAVLRTVMQRLRSTEASLREREKLAGLGTLSAGLAHELNNPAAAAGRSVRRLAAALATSALPSPPDDARPATSALERAERVEQVAAFVSDPDAAAALADAGWTADALGALSPEDVRSVAADASVQQLLDELELAVTRISETVAAVKGYAYLDQAPMQRIDVRTGLDQTLVILRHRLRDGVEVKRRYADGVPEIEAFGSELNQVWTNLVDNAIDAMDGRGILTLSLDPDGDGVRVTICDSGSGIPEAIRQRLFEPFATTKPPGKGTGLGLHIAHTVVARHGGRIEVDSKPGSTCFVVHLPGAALA